MIGRAVAKRLRANPVTSLGGSIEVPGDKSISHRAVMLSAIAEGTSTIRGFLRAEDCLATLAAMKHMGVSVSEPDERTLIVEGVGMHGLKPPTQDIDLGNSGTAMRLMTGLLAAQRFDSCLVGDASLMLRPMARVADPLARMGAKVQTQAGRPPIRIEAVGGLRGIDASLPVASAQVKSAILIAGLYARGTTSVSTPGVTRDHTERMLASMGVDIVEDRARNLVSLDGPQALRGLEIRIPGDFSSAAFFIVAGCLGSESAIRINNVGINPTRTGLLDILRLMGARIDVADTRFAGSEPVADLVVHRSELRGIDVPETLVALAIDEFPVLFVAAACAHGRTRVRGAEELRHKESDRLGAMARALTGVGVEVSEVPDGLDIVGGPMAGGAVDSMGDHRIAMAMVVASLRARKPIEIENTAQVATSFPSFVDVASSIGFDVMGIASARP